MRRMRGGEGSKVCGGAARLVRVCSAIGVVAGMLGCSDGQKPLRSASIGAAGGRIGLPDGTALEVPEGALSATTVLTIGATRAPAGALGPAYRFGPSGLVFAKPVTVVLPVSAAVPAGVPPTVLTAPDDGEAFTALSAVSRDDTHLAAETSHFSVFVAGVSTGPRALASGEHFPGAMLLDQGTAYWVNQGNLQNPFGRSGQGLVMRAATSGGGPQALTPGLSDPRALTIASGTLYVALGGMDDPDAGVSGSAIVSVPASGGAPQPVVTDVTFPVALANDGTSLYWLDADRGTVAKAPLAGGPATVLSSGHRGLRGLAVAGGSVYFSAQDDGAVMSVPAAGGTTSALAMGQGKPTTLAVDGGYVYWIATGDGAVRRAPADGGAAQTVASGFDRPAGLAVQGGTVTFGVQGEGTIRSVSASGGASTVLATGQAIPFALARDTWGAVWTANGNGDYQGAVLYLPN